MSATWVVGDIHGCAEELAALLERLTLEPGDRLISVGDLYHRGPDPVGVAQQLAALPGFELVLGNHERAMLRRAGLVGERADGQDGLPMPDDTSAWGPEVLAGDGRTPMDASAAGQEELLLGLLVQQPYFRLGQLEDGSGWVVVHAGVVPGAPLEEAPPELLCSVRRLRHLPGQPYWYEAYPGPDLVLFGHTPSPIPRARHARGRLVALGLDTGCVYGGSLTAYRLEDGEIEVVDAQRDYAGSARDRR